MTISTDPLTHIFSSSDGIMLYNSDTAIIKQINVSSSDRESYERINPIKCPLVFDNSTKNDSN